MRNGLFATLMPQNGDRSFVRIRCFLFVLLSVSFTALGTSAQEPAPGPARPVSVPAVKEATLKNGLRIAVIEKRGVPLISVQMLIRSGAAGEGMKKAGLANLTADMLTKGTKTRSAQQVAEEMEFLGSSINSGAGWNSSNVGMTVTADKLNDAMAIFSDVLLNPAFSQEELDLLRSQTLDDLKGNLQQPGFLASYVASVYTYGEHPTGGTPDSIQSISREDIASFYGREFTPANSVLIFVGDISSNDATKAAERFFGGWAQGRSDENVSAPNRSSRSANPAIYSRILVVDLPNSGQASVNYVLPISGGGRKNADYYPASVLNSLLGGGYSSRLNQEIRIKRGLSYGARSGFGWRDTSATFGASAQTKVVSAAEVAELIIAEIERLRNVNTTEGEILPRKAVLTGGFGRNLETNQGLAGALGELYSFGIPTSELNAYMAKVDKVPGQAIRSFAQKNLVNGDIVIVGDYAQFKEDLAKRFPTAKIEVVKADEVDIESPTLRRSDIP
ncbi:MAG: M16 family metallopeptidase [Pyrinomonadaceae bacterium]